jgi:hypothetical protein
MASISISGMVRLCFGEKQTTFASPLSGTAFKKLFSDRILKLTSSGIIAAKSLSKTYQLSY